MVKNVVLLGFIVLIIAIFGDKTSKYLRFGPNNDLELLGIKLNTWNRYLLFQAMTCIIKMTEVYIGELANPILGFNVYNPDKKEITDFSRLELQLYTNCMWIIGSIRGVLMVVISIAQIDVALLQVIYGEMMSFYTVRTLLNEKKFPEDTYENVPLNDVIEMV